jgi:hypothetical protein
MTKTPAEGMVELAKMAGEFVEAVVEQEAQALHLMQVELEVLAKPLTKPTEAEAAQQEEETESSFDNMPV